MNTTSIFAVSTLGFLIFLLAIKKKKIQADRYLIAFLLTILLGILNDYIFNEYPNFRHLLVLGSVTVPLCATFLYMYVKSLISSFDLLKFKNIALFIPSIFVLVFNVFYPEYDVVHSNDIALIVFYYAVKLGFSLFLIFASKMLLVKYRKTLKQNLSEIETVDFKWLHFIFNLSIALFAVVFIFIGLYLANLISSFEYLSSFIGISIFVFVLILAYYGIKNTQTFKDVVLVDNSKSEPITESPENTIREHAETDRKEIDKKLIDSLEQVMENEKPFLLEKLTIAELSQKTNIPQKQLSQIINTHYNQNFFDFVNSYRIKEFNKKIKNGENKNFTLLAIAYDSGFNSKSAFNRAYKKHVGVPPSEFLKSGTTRN